MSMIAAENARAAQMLPSHQRGPAQEPDRLNRLNLQIRYKGGKAAFLEEEI